LTLFQKEKDSVITAAGIGGLLEELHHAACMCFRKETTYKESCEEQTNCAAVSL
jgi:hypothetical protein